MNNQPKHPNIEMSKLLGQRVICVIFYEMHLHGAVLVNELLEGETFACTEHGEELKNA